MPMPDNQIQPERPLEIQIIPVLLISIRHLTP